MAICGVNRNDVGIGPSRGVARSNIPTSGWGHRQLQDSCGLEFPSLTLSRSLLPELNEGSRSWVTVIGEVEVEIGSLGKDAGYDRTDQRGYTSMK